MKVLTAVLSKNRKWVLAAFAASLIGVAASLIWTFYIGELVNKIEAREHISIRFLGFMGLLITAQEGTSLKEANDIIWDHLSLAASKRDPTASHFPVSGY